jgi:hypothetical protein
MAVVPSRTLVSCGSAAAASPSGAPSSRRVHLSASAASASGWGALADGAFLATRGVPPSMTTTGGGGNNNNNNNSKGAAASSAAPASVTLFHFLGLRTLLKIGYPVLGRAFEHAGIPVRSARGGAAVGLGGGTDPVSVRAASRMALQLYNALSRDDKAAVMEKALSALMMGGGGGGGGGGAGGSSSSSSELDGRASALVAAVLGSAAGTDLSRPPPMPSGRRGSMTGRRGSVGGGGGGNDPFALALGATGGRQSSLSPSKALGSPTRTMGGGRRKSVTHGGHGHRGGGGGGGGGAASLDVAVGLGDLFLSMGRGAGGGSAPRYSFAPLPPPPATDDGDADPDAAAATGEVGGAQFTVARGPGLPAELGAYYNHMRRVSRDPREGRIQGRSKAAVAILNREFLG